MRLHDNGFMLQKHDRVLAPRLTAFALAALAAASATWWVLHWPAAQPVAVTQPPQAEAFAPDPQSLARVLGSGQAVPAAPPALSSRLQLVGVVADRSGVGAALIAVDGKPARSYAVGSKVVDDLLVQSVAPRRAMLAANPRAPVALTLELKAPLR